MRVIVNPNPPQLGRVVAIANQKGGVGKTTTAINLGTALAACGKTILLIDIDPQGNASTGLGIQNSARAVTSYDVVLGGAKLSEAVIRTQIPGFDLIPSVVDLSAAEVELVERPRREYRLREALAGADKDYDYVLIDCPPSLGLLTVNALVAARSVLVPLQCEFFALEGLSLLLRTIDRVRRSFNPRLEVQGILLTMLDRRNNLAQQVATDVRSFLGKRVYDTVIPRNVRVSEAPSHGMPVLLYDFRCPGAQAYVQFAGEVLRREQRRRPRYERVRGRTAAPARASAAWAWAFRRCWAVRQTWLEPGRRPHRYRSSSCVRRRSSRAAISARTSSRRSPNSIRAKGVMQPLLVRRVPDADEHYEIVAGERRWRAAQIAGCHELPVVVYALSDREALELALLENVQRQDLTPLEEADGYRRLIEEFGHTQEELARTLGKSRSHIANLIRLLGLPPLRVHARRRQLSAGHARALLGARDPVPLARQVVARWT